MYKDAELAEIAYNGDFSKLSTRSPPKPQNHINNLNDDGKTNKKKRKILQKQKLATKLIQWNKSWCFHFKSLDVLISNIACVNQSIWKFFIKKPKLIKSQLT